MVTVERFFSCVFAFVYFQITSLSARIVALVTLERLFSSVFEPLWLQTRSMSTGIVTLLTFVGFLACVLSEGQLEEEEATTLREEEDGMVQPLEATTCMLEILRMVLDSASQLIEVEATTLIKVSLEEAIMVESTAEEHKVDQMIYQLIVIRVAEEDTQMEVISMEGEEASRVKSAGVEV